MSGSRKRILSTLFAAVLALGLIPTIAFAEGGDGSDSSQPQATITVTDREGLQTALNDGGSITLGANINGDFTVPSNSTAALDLADYTITNTASHTITVESGASLTITGVGTVDNITHAKAPIWNNGTVILSGGNYTRSEEKGESADVSGGNSYYALVNHGTMIINDGVSVIQDGHFSSLVENGYYSYSSNNPSNGHVEGTNAANPTMTINGGTFTGGLNTIKNDDGASLTINDGTFSNYTQAVVQNHNVATINGGTFTAGDAENDTYGVDNCGCMAETDIGTLTITGGTFEGATYGVYDRSGIADVKVTISGGNILGTQQALKKATGSTASFDVYGGTFSSSVSAFLREGYICSKNADNTYTVLILDESNAAAQITNSEGVVSYYKSFTAAANAVENGGTVKLLRDDTVTYGPATIDGTDITIDLGGYKLSCKYQSVLTIKENSSVAVKGGTLFSANTGWSPTLAVEKNVKLTIEADATIIGPYGFGLDDHTSDGGSGVQVDIFGTVRGINSADDTSHLASGGTVGIGINGKINSAENCATIHIHDGAVVSGANGTSGNANSDDGPAIYAAGYVSWIIDNGATLSGDESLSIKAGNFTINGGTFIANGDFVDPATSWGNGTEATGAAISITNNNGYARKVQMTISGGTFVSEKGYALYENDTQSQTGNPLGDEGVKISGGNFDGVQGAIYAKHGCAISGGYFTSDPSAYVADDYVAVESDKSGYNFMVIEKGAAAAEVVVAAPSVADPDLPGDASEEDRALANQIKDELTTGETQPSISQDVLEAAANSVANGNALTAEDGKEALEEAKIIVNEGGQRHHRGPALPRHQDHRRERRGRQVHHAGHHAHVQDRGNHGESVRS